MSDSVLLPRDTNQARGLARYALDFICGPAAQPDEAVYRKLTLFHRDSVGCAVAALSAGLNAPRILREEALDYALSASGPSRAAASGASSVLEPGATCFGSRRRVPAEKAVVANASAVRELDANGTNFGYDPRRGNTRGEFGHNDFYPVVIAAAQQTRADGWRTLLAMLCLDEIRGRLAEVFALRDHKIDHVLHGAIASAAVYGAMLGATERQIESAVGLVVAHYVPFRAIRAGQQLSDSKGASAALSSELAVLSVHRAMRGFQGPADVFRNPQAIFRLFEPPARDDCSPFDLQLTLRGGDFAVAGMHFKLGLYEHQSAGAIQGLHDLLQAHPQLLESAAPAPGSTAAESAPESAAEAIEKVRITIYEPAFSIIGDPAKRDPRTRQSADHSMVYIIATLLGKALRSRRAGWRSLMLTLDDYQDPQLFDPLTRRLIDKIEFIHGGARYDSRYPDGIPTSLAITHRQHGTFDSGLVMYPLGHARRDDRRLRELLDFKFDTLAGVGIADPPRLRSHLDNLPHLTADEIAALYSFEIEGLE